jgi:hypothetical protein
MGDHFVICCRPQVVLSCQVRECDSRVRPLLQLPCDAIPDVRGVLQHVGLVSSSWGAAAAAQGARLQGSKPLLLAFMANSTTLYCQRWGKLSIAAAQSHEVAQQQHTDVSGCCGDHRQAGRWWHSNSSNRGIQVQECRMSRLLPKEFLKCIFCSKQHMCVSHTKYSVLVHPPLAALSPFVQV